MHSLNVFIQDIDSSNDFNKSLFNNELKRLNKNYNESNNVNQEYFKNDFDLDTYTKNLETIVKKYNDDKKNNNLTDFTHFILENYPPLTLSKTIDEFKKNPNIKILPACYSKSYTKIYNKLINKEKIGEKILSLVSEMFNENVELKSTENNNGEETDNEDDNHSNDGESVMTNYTSNKKNND